MKIINLFFACFLILTVNSLFGQEFKVPENYSFKVAADYTKYEKDIIAAAKWLMETPFDQQTEKRKEVSKFVILWVNGSPTVRVEINPTILKFNEKNEGMLVLWMACCAKYVLENNYSTDMRAKHKAALKDLISVYEAGKGIKKDKEMEKLIKSDKAGKLDKWLDKNLKVG